MVHAVAGLYVSLVGILVIVRPYALSAAVDRNLKGAHEMPGISGAL